MKISLDELIALITKEVVKELNNRGIKIDNSYLNNSNCGCTKESTQKSIELDFTGYVTPLVTEEKINELSESISEIVVPKNTIITPSAVDLIKERNIKINKLN